MEKQDAVVIPFADAESEDLHLTTFGKSVTQPGHTYGPAVRSYYLLHFITQGQGKFTVGQKTYQLHAGQGFLIAPDYLTVYQSSQENPWTYIWVAFNGKRAADTIHSLGLNQEMPIFSCNEVQGQQLQRYVEAMLNCNEISVAGNYYRLGLLFQFLSIVAASQRNPAELAEGNVYIAHMIDYIRAHIEEPFTVQDLADYMNLNRSYMCTLFKKYMQMSPHDYIQQCRLTKAAHLLQTTKLPIEIIAYSCGYAKHDSFTRAFVKQLQVTPKEYRQQHYSAQKF